MKGRAHRTGIAKPVDLDRRWPAREHAKARIARVAVDVDKDIDAVFRNLRCGFVIGDATDVAPVIDARLDTRLDRIVRLDAGVVGEHLEILAGHALRRS